MTEEGVEPRMLLVLRFDEAVCAVDATEIVAIDQDGVAARVSVSGAVRDLAEYLPHCTSAAPPVRLIIDFDGGRRGFLARASIELIQTSSLYRLPRLVRDCGCASWVRGVVLDREQPGLWLHLGRLAHATEQDAVQ